MMFHRTARGAIALLLALAMFEVFVPASSTAGVKDADDSVSPAATRSQAPRGVVSDAPASPASTEAAREYWTPERMRNALPIEQALGLSGDDVTSEEVVDQRVARANRLHVPSTTGKLFFRANGGDYVCSAATINTRRKNQVITAGHCVHSGPNGGMSPQWFKDFVFVPKYHNGNAPLGRWHYKKVWAFTKWTKRGNFRYDQAVMKMRNRNGKTIVRKVGGNGLRFEASQRQRGVRIWGWPAEGQYNGEVAVYCQGRTTRRRGSTDAWMKCPMNGGASGGPWLLKKNRRRNVGIIWAITSRRTVGTFPKRLMASPIPIEMRGLLRYINR